MSTIDKPIWNTGLVNNGKLEQVYEMAIVRHGHWIDRYGMTCSKCGYEIPHYRFSTEYLYCPHCGAKMDERKEDVGIS